MAFQPKVSIVIPVFNGSDFLAAAIESALAQTYPNCEVIVVNDGSNDRGKTKKVAKAYGGRIRYLEKKNGGVATALNLGIEKMRGEYLSWLSHDDLYLPNKVADQISYLEKHPEERDSVLYGDFKLIDADDKELAKIQIPTIIPKAFMIALVASSPVSGCTTLVPRKLLTKEMRFRPLRTTQDYDLWFRLARAHRFINTRSCGVLSRQHPNQGSQVLSALHRQESEQLYASCLDIIVREESRWSKVKNPADAYREMAEGLIQKRCFGAARIAFRRLRHHAKISTRQHLGFLLKQLSAAATDRAYHLRKALLSK